MHRRCQRRRLGTGLTAMRTLVEVLQVFYIGLCVALAVAYCGIIAGAL